VGTDKDAESPVTLDSIEWADIIFVMERRHRHKLCSMFGSRVRRKKIVCLDIPDEFDYMDPVLVRLLKIVVPRHLPAVFMR
jgi:predicted protein tyrosine phosphatase